MKRTSKRVLFVTFTFVFVWQVVAFLTATLPCQKAAIDELCTLWKNGDVEGDWCFHLCEAQKKSCDGITHFGKQLVVRLEGPFGKGVVKGRYARWDDDSSISDLQLNPENPIEDFQQRVIARIADVQNTQQIDPSIRERIGSLAVSEVQRRNFLQLMHQREFIWSLLYSRRSHESPFPQLRGTCGHVFIVEECDETLDAVKQWTVRDRLKAMVKVVDLLMIFEKHDVQICDFKWEHFGLFYNQTASNSNWNSFIFTIKPLDLDAVFTWQSLKLTLDNYKCETDDDCDFFDCKGQCIKDDGNRRSICVPSRTDSNMRRFLKMISGSYFPPQKSLFDGIHNQTIVAFAEGCQTSRCDLPLFRRRLLEAILNPDST